MTILPALILVSRTCLLHELGSIRQRGSLSFPCATGLVACPRSLLISGQTTFLYYIRLNASQAKWRRRGVGRPRRGSWRRRAFRIESNDGSDFGRRDRTPIFRSKSDPVRGSCFREPRPACGARCRSGRREAWLQRPSKCRDGLPKREIRHLMHSPCIAAGDFA